MTKKITMQEYAENYLSEHRSLGFAVTPQGYSINSFACYVDKFNPHKPLTVEIMADWARQDKNNSNKPETWARRLKKLRPFARYLQQFEPLTEVPDDSVFGRIPPRRAPHIYTESEIVDLLKAARQLNPPDGLRGATYEMLFGLMASTGIRVSEAVHLLSSDVDLKHGILNVRNTKFAKSRSVPLHPSTVKVLRKYHSLCNSYIDVNKETPFFIGSRGQRLGQQISTGTVRHVFAGLRKQLGWINRGAHDAPRIHDLRHSFVVHRVIQWHIEEIDIDQRMLALSTYIGHAAITNTYWYLSGVPELMELSGNKFEKYTQASEVDHV